MSTDKTFSFDSKNLDDTLSFASKVGSNLKGGEVIELRSDIGGGKTTFVRGLAEGAGSADEVASPTFTLSRVYGFGSDKQIQHFDFYRLEDPGIMRIELAEHVSDEDTVVVVEWADVVEAVLPADRAVITIESSGEESRAIELNPGIYEHLLEGMEGQL